MPAATLRQLLEAGVHFGHQTSRWNPRMRPYIFAARNGIHIIDLEQTQAKLDEARDYVRELVAGGQKILFVAAGAFNVARPSDLIPEFQGRFPIRVELQPLSEQDLVRVLTEPSNSLTKQYQALLATEKVQLEFAEDGIRELARHAHLINDEDENIGARRLFTVMEKMLEELSFRAEDFAGQTVTIDAEYVSRSLTELVRNQDIRRFVL